MSNFTRRWTQFALQAEYDQFGTARFVKAHNEQMDKLVTLQAQLAMANAVIGDLSKELRDYADTHVSMRRFYEYLDKYPGEVKG